MLCDFNSSLSLSLPACDILIPNVSLDSPPNACPQNASTYLIPALSTFCSASVMVNILNVHSCTPSFQLSVTFGALSVLAASLSSDVLAVSLLLQAINSMIAENTTATP